MSNKKLEELKVPEVIMDRKNAPRKSSLMAPNHPPVRKRSVSFRPVVVPTDDGKLPNLEGRHFKFQIILQLQVESILLS